MFYLRVVGTSRYISTTAGPVNIYLEGIGLEIVEENSTYECPRSV
jgi:hypothetical protein